MNKKKLLLGSVSTGIIKEISKTSQISPEKLVQIEENLESDLARKLGHNWAMIPAKGPYVMALFLIFNYTLVPLGITPSTVADASIKKINELNLDEKIGPLITSAKTGLKSGGEYSSEKYAEFTDYMGDTGKKFGKEINHYLNEGKGIVDIGMDKSRGFLRRILNRKKNPEENNE